MKLHFLQDHFMLEQKNILFTGGNGLLGTEFKKQLPDVVYSDFNDFDITGFFVPRKELEYFKIIRRFTETIKETGYKIELNSKIPAVFLIGLIARIVISVSSLNECFC